MSITVLSQAAAVVIAIAALGAGPLQSSSPEPIETIQVVVRVGESQDLHGFLPPATSRDLIAKSLVEPPHHGDYFDGDYDTFRYEPNDSFFGRDRLVIEATLPNKTVRFAFEIDVLPRYFPLIGRWQGGTTYLAGFYDTQNRRLVTCGKVLAEGGLTCQSQNLGSVVPTGGIPVILPATEGQAEQVGIFDLSTGKMFRLVLRGGSFHLTGVKTYADAKGHFPVVGDFFGNGQTLAFVDRNGKIISYGNGGNGDAKSEWPKLLGAPREDQLTWPVRFPLDDVDAIALIDPHTRFVEWQTAEERGDNWFAPNVAVLRPVHWPGGVLALNVTGDCVLFVLSEVDGHLQLTGYNITDMTPATIPITFPNDPPNG